MTAYTVVMTLEDHRAWCKQRRGLRQVRLVRGKLVSRYQGPARIRDRGVKQHMQIVQDTAVALDEAVKQSKKLADNREEIKLTFRAMQGAGQTMAYRMMDRMVERIVYGSPNPSLVPELEKKHPHDERGWHPDDEGHG